MYTQQLLSFKPVTGTLPPSAIHEAPPAEIRAWAFLSSSARGSEDSEGTCDGSNYVPYRIHVGITRCMPILFVRSRYVTELSDGTWESPWSDTLVVSFAHYRWRIFGGFGGSTGWSLSTHTTRGL